MASGNPIVGLWNTSAGGDGTTAIAGLSSGNYAPMETPTNVFDSNCSTKYTSFGACRHPTINPPASCGVDTGFHVSLSSGPIILRSLQFCTGNDNVNRDPLTVTVEGANTAGSVLLLGSSWSLIYNGSTGLDTDPGRKTFGGVQTIANSIAYTNYRFLITSKRGVNEALQYSDIRLFQ